MHRKILPALGAVLLLGAASYAQQATAPKSADQLGMACPEILALSSTDWVERFQAAKGRDQAASIRAINAYGNCYQARTDQLARSLGRTGKGPLMGARGDFLSLEKAIKAFAAKALAESEPPADSVKRAYAALYEKQFRYEFYESYELPLPTKGTNSAQGATSAEPRGSTAPPAPGATGNAAIDAAAAAEAQAAKDEAERNKSDADPVTQAKNHFGELLGALPDVQMHDLHSAFGQILGPNSASRAMQLLVYRYAIFLLEPPGATPFAPPPF